MIISVCIITKNEAEKLKKCLAALKQLVSEWEIVVVDTGSKDESLEIAAAAGARVYHYDWCDDFAAAKNYAVSKASHNIVLVLDTDEYLDQIDVTKLKQLLTQHTKDIGRIRRNNVYLEDGERCCNREWISRIFHRGYYHYEGCIHEQLVPIGGIESAKGKGAQEVRGNTYEAPLVILHDGYDGTAQQKKEKALRNKRLLLQELKNRPEDPYLLYQLGKSCYMAGDYPEAVTYFEKATSIDLDPNLEYVIDLVETYGYSLLKTQHVREALLFENLLPEFGNTADFAFLMGLIYMNNELFDQAVESFQRATTYKEARAEGANSYKAWYNAGVIKECLGNIEEAVDDYRKCGPYEKAAARLQQILT